MKAVILAGGSAPASARRPRSQAQADDRDRRQADPLAHHEDLLGPRLQRLRRSAAATRATSSRSTSPTTSCTCPTSRSTCADNAMEVHQQARRAWKVTLVDTGERHDDRRAAQARARRTSDDDDVLPDLRRRRQPTSTSPRCVALPPAARQARRRSRPCSRRAAIGALEMTGRPRCAGFIEKPRGDGGLDQRRVLRALAARASTRSTATTLAGARAARASSPPTASSRAFEHRGFWQPMDTLRDKNAARRALGSGKAPWKIW